MIMKENMNAAVMGASRKPHHGLTWIRDSTSTGPEKAFHFHSAKNILLPCSSFLMGLDEFLYAAVKGLFNIIREKAGRQFAHSPMVLYTFTADTFPAARFICTVAS